MAKLLSTARFLSIHNRTDTAVSVKDCFAKLHDLEGNCFFRGVSNSKYKLISSFGRRAEEIGHPHRIGQFGRAIRETLLIEQFQRNAHNHVAFESIPKKKSDWLAFMQHHGVPTRLLDMTRSPFIALYFAVREWWLPEDAAVWIVNPISLHETLLHRLVREKFDGPVDPYKYYISNLPELLSDEHFEKLFFSKRDDVAMLFVPNWSNPRLSAQQGAFFVTSNPQIPVEDIVVAQLQDKSHYEPEKQKFLDKGGYDFSFRKLIVPGNLKRELFHGLYQMNVHGGTLFPGLEGAALATTEYGLM